MSIAIRIVFGVICLTIVKFFPSDNSLCESTSLVMPEIWAGRHDVFDARQDFYCLLAKSKLSGNLRCENKTNREVKICISGQRVRDCNELESYEIRFMPNQAQVFDFFRYEDIFLKEGSHGFLNFTSSALQYQIFIENDPVLLFPRVLPFFSFIPDISGDITSLPIARKQEIQAYRVHVCVFERRICREEGVSPIELYRKRAELYDRFKIEAMLTQELPETPRIPLTLYHIWLTDPNAPKEPPLWMLEFVKRCRENNSALAGWQHYFLVQNADLFVKSKEFLKDLCIEFVNISDFLGTLELQEEFDESLLDLNFGQASDILRVEVLRKFGGGYLDSDLVVVQPLKAYFYLYDSVFGIEPWSEYIGNAFMACAANHPVMLEMTRLIKRNFAIKRQGERFYTEGPPDKKLNAILRTGPGPLTFAFHHRANENGFKDIAMPPEAFFPGNRLIRPEPRIPTANSALRPFSATLHLWMNSWV